MAFMYIVFPHYLCMNITSILHSASQGVFLYRHLRECHCTKEGGSFVCRYGYNGVCSSLPLEGVSDQDYEDHVLKHHAFAMFSKSKGDYVTKARNYFSYTGIPYSFIAIHIC